MLKETMEWTDDPPKLTYTVPEIAAMLGMNVRTAYNYCSQTTDFKVLHMGRLIRVHKQSFDKWFTE